jgi:hypothetical protein
MQRMVIRRFITKLPALTLSVSIICNSFIVLITSSHTDSDPLTL